MESNTKKPSPYLSANCLSKLTFWWILKIFRLGESNNLRPENLYDVLPENVSETLGDRLEISWESELKEAQMQRRKPNLRKAIRKTFGWRIFKHSIGLLISNALDTVQPVLLTRLLMYFRPFPAMSAEAAYICASVLIPSIILQMMVTRHVLLAQYTTGMHVRIACSSLIYRKTLKLSSASASSTINGFIINVLSNDLTKLEYYIVFMPFIQLVPLLLVAIFYLTWNLLGDAAFIGILLMITQIIPPQVILRKVAKKLRADFAASTDKRVMLIGEIISGIKVIKMYAWENYFEKLVHLARKHEIGMIRKLSYVKAANWSMPMFTDRIAMFCTIYTYLWLGNTISADIIFPAVKYFGLMRQTLAVLWLEAVFYSSLANVAINRIEEFLLYEEMRPISASTGTTNIGEIFIKNLEASWSDQPLFNRINIHVSPKKLCAIVGPVGSGKSSILKLILGELQAKAGNLLLNGTVSYANQEPWLFTGSVKSNILFGEEYYEERYKKVVDVCQLLRDLEQLPSGDKTLVGEKGVRLSGGQCARVNLARAVYRDADIYLFDDPLSAVDGHVGKGIFDDCINGLLKDKTRIFVTHQLQFLKKVDEIIIMDDGSMKFQGNYEDFITVDGNLDYLSSHNEDEKEDTREIVSKEMQRSVSIEEKEFAREYEPDETKEILTVGRVKYSLMLNFFSANGSYWSLSLIALLCLLTQLTISLFDYWLSFWTKQEEKRKEHLESSIIGETTVSDANLHEKYLSTQTALWVAGGLAIAIVALSILKNVFFLKRILNSSETIHNRMFSRLLRAPLQFFIVNPSGRMSNRFSKDTGTVDDEIPDTLTTVIEGALLTIAVIIQVIITNWWTIFPVIIVGFLFVKINNIYLTTSQTLKRLEANAKSPVFSLVNSTFVGLATIRSCHAQNIVRRDFDERQDAHTAAYHLRLVTSAALSMWVQCLVACVTTFVVYSFIFVKSENTMAGDVGLALTQLMSICGITLQFAMRQFAALMTEITSAERMFEYTELDQEELSYSESQQILEENWPREGEIKFENLNLRYSDEVPPVLKNLNFTISPNMKVGVVGRTGAGKSSLIAALFRLAEFDGCLSIDNVNIKNISLLDLRSKISIIPQEPTIFTASLRDNLDPLHLYDDALLWSVLRDIKMNGIFDNLEQPINGNLSAGQRQLICLSRAMLKKNKILVLDEATANVDPITDELIQNIIRSKFRDCTVLTIAHRLNTVMDSDAILAMDAGRVIEFDQPHNLLQKRNGYFSKIVEQSRNSVTFKKVVRKTYNASPNAQSHRFVSINYFDEITRL